MGRIVVRNQPCPNCSSSDAFQVYEDDSGYCFSCETPVKNIHETEFKEREVMTEFASQLNLEEIEQLGIRSMPDRKISKPIMEHFKVRSETDNDGTVTAQYYPYTVEGEVVAYKKRLLPKQFSIVGSFSQSNCELFGQSNFASGGNRVIITEGELDAMAVAHSAFVKYKKVYPVVSLPSASMLTPLKNNRKWLRSFKEVILWLDNDEKGDTALREAAKIIGFDKVKVVKSLEKDANDTLVKQGEEATMQCVWNAKQYSPAGLITDPEQIWEEMVEYSNKKSIPYPPCLAGLNDKLKGMRTGEITLWTSGTGSGKSTLLREIMLHLLETTDEKIGLVSLEESPSEVARKLSGMVLNKNPAKDEIPLADLRPGFDTVFGDGRVIVLDHHGSIRDGSIIDTLESMCVMGAKYLFLDHITILVSEGSEGLTGNEAVDKVMNDLLSLVKRHDVWIGLVSHLRKMDKVGKSFEDGQMASLDDIRGSGSIKQISFDILAFARDLNGETEKDKNTIRMNVLKSRFTGLTGSCGTAIYNYDTGRLVYGGEAESKELKAFDPLDVEI